MERLSLFWGGPAAAGGAGCENRVDFQLGSLLQVGVEKPDPRIFRQALELSGDSPEECLYVGDNYYDDGVGAAQVGMAFCILNPAGRLGIEELDIPWCVPDIRQVGEVLDALNAAQ